MKCDECGSKAVQSNRCKDHFVAYFEKKALDCIDDFKLIEKKDKVCVAVSGGKDSLTVLHILKKWFVKNKVE